uniref:Uncharacterized protein n=1 Tax=Branchiostoma floridae TaxID=7739 RepID=C3YZZ5_BRAFL|eukprot:XP_002598042.1 hypothetical protein BRAFLDRAFT_108614 [Branchiostoma floridae]
MSSLPGSSRPLHRGRSPHGPTKTTGKPRYSYLLPRTDLNGCRRSWIVGTGPAVYIGQVPVKSTRRKRLVIWRDGGDRGVPRDPVKPLDQPDNQFVAVEGKDSSLKKEKSLGEETAFKKEKSLPEEIWLEKEKSPSEEFEKKEKSPSEEISLKKEKSPSEEFEKKEKSLSKGIAFEKEKSLSEEFEKEKSLSEKFEKEKSLSEENALEKEKSLSEEIEKEKSLSEAFEKEKSLSEEIAFKKEKSLFKGIALEKEKSMSEEFEKEKSLSEEIAIEKEKTLSGEFGKEKSLSEEFAKEKSLSEEIAIEKEKTLSGEFGKEKSLSEEFEKEKSLSEGIAFEKEKSLSEEVVLDKEKSLPEEVEHIISVDSRDKKVPLERQPTCDSLFTGTHLNPAGVWRPYGPPLYGYGSALNPRRWKCPDTLVILAAIFYCLAVLTAVVFAVLFKTNVVTFHTPPEPVPAWVQQFSPVMQRWYRLALAGGRDASEIQPPGTVQQPTLPPPVEEFCGSTSLSESLPDLRHGDFRCVSIAYYDTYVTMCIAKCHMGYQTDDAGLLFCNRGRWAPIQPEVVSTLVGVGRAADTMPNTDPRALEYLGIPDVIYADVAFNILVKLDYVPNLSIVKTYLNSISENNIIDHRVDMMRQMLIWIGPNIEDIIDNLDFLDVLSRLGRGLKP